MGESVTKNEKHQHKCHKDNKDELILDASLFIKKFFSTWMKQQPDASHIPDTNDLHTYLWSLILADAGVKYAIQIYSYANLYRRGSHIINR